MWPLHLFQMLHWHSQRQHNKMSFWPNWSSSAPHKNQPKLPDLRDDATIESRGILIKEWWRSTRRTKSLGSGEHGRGDRFLVPRKCRCFSLWLLSINEERQKWDKLCFYFNQRWQMVSKWRPAKRNLVAPKRRRRPLYLNQLFIFETGIQAIQKDQGNSLKGSQMTRLGGNVLIQNGGPRRRCWLRA